MTFRLPAIAATLLVAAIASPAAAAEEDWCGPFDFNDVATFLPATVTGEGRAHLQGFGFECTEGGQTCRLTSYLISGDEVVVSRQTKGAYSCVAFVGKAGESTGWIETRRLKMQVLDEHPAANLWIGKWRRDPQAGVSIRVKDGKLYASGHAVWYSYAYPTRNGEPSRIENADLSDWLVVEENRARTGAADGLSYCDVRMAMIGPYILLEDDNACGGLNVTFRGFYRRMSPR